MTQTRRDFLLATASAGLVATTTAKPGPKDLPVPRHLVLLGDSIFDNAVGKMFWG